MKKRNIILLAVGILPIIVGWLCNSLLFTGFGWLLMSVGSWLWLAVCIAAADRKGKVITQSLLLFAVGIVMMVLYFCYQSFWADTVSIFSPLNTWPQYYLGNWSVMAARIYALIRPSVFSSGPIYVIASVLGAVFTFAGVFIKTRFKNVEKDF